MKKSYRDLDIYEISFDLFLRVHAFSLKLPKYEMYELGSQIRRSADGVNSNIVEGYGRRRYKKDFIRFLVYAHSGNDETKNHLLKIKTLYPYVNEEAGQLYSEYDRLGIKIHNFINYVINNWKSDG